MDSSISKPLSKLNNKQRSNRVTRQTLQTLKFIHRFRLVTARHVQLNLEHVFINPTYRHLKQLCDKGYIAKLPDSDKRNDKRGSTYYLTTVGLELLQLNYPERNFRRVRSLQADATMPYQLRERYLTLADVYVHFKRHYNGHFEFFTAFDLMHLDYMPDIIPDGFVRTEIPGSEIRYYFIEIFGWGRSAPDQQRRLQSYIRFASNDTWQVVTGLTQPSLFIVATSPRNRERLHTQLRREIDHSLVTDLAAFSTLTYLLDGEVSSIWREI